MNIYKKIKHILAVDDIIDNLKILEIILKTNNYKISMAQNGRKGLKMAQDLFERAAEQLKEASKIKTDNLNDKKELDILNMNIHFLLEKASIAKAFYLINKEIKDYNELIEQFKLASTHDDLEADFAAQVGDIQRVSRARARKYYCEGQIFRFKGMMALQNNEIKKAKEYYLHASEFFDKSSKLDNEWDENEKMAKESSKEESAQLLKKRIADFSEVLTKISAGDYKARVEVEGIKDPELKQLGVEVNQLAATLEEKVTEMYEQNKELTIGISTIVDVTKSVGTGDLTAKAKEKFKSFYLSRLAQNINKMVDGFTEMISGIMTTSQALTLGGEDLKNNAKRVGDMAEEISKTTQEISKSSQEQSEKTEEARKTVIDMSSTLNLMAASIEKTAEKANEVNQVAQEGGESAGKGLESLSEIRSSVDESAESISGLNEKSQEIGKIVSTITHIAEQTNLLALNATIEAARAGDAGRGFAVVADEVRKLAESSAGAADKISELIEGMQESTSKSVDSMQKSTNKVKEGTDVVGNALKSLEKISEAISDVSTQVEEVSASAQEQSSGAQQVVEIISSITAAAQQNASATQEISAATQEELGAINEVTRISQEFSDLAEELNSKIEKFKISEEQKKEGEKNEPGNKDKAAKEAK